MDVANRTVVITGGGSGIGAALANRVVAAGAAHVVLVDLDGDAAARVADTLGSRAVPLAADVASAEANRTLVDTVEETVGPIDVFCANAGIGTGTGLGTPAEAWERIWAVNTLAPVWAAETLVPRWIERGGGHLMITASAAGLLTNLGDLPYSTTKAAAVAVARWLAVTYAHRGVGVSCLCPQGVRTPLLFPGGTDDALALAVVRHQRVIEASEVADAVLEAWAEDRFLILPHPEVADYSRTLATDTERWLRAMNRMQAGLEAQAPRP